MTLLLLSLALAAVPRADAPRVVTVDWLAAHLHDRGLVVFQIGDDRSRPTYDAGHIPGSRFLKPLSELSAPRGGAESLILEMPSPERLDSVLESKGVSDDSRIVLVHADEYFSPTGRAALVLAYAGFEGRTSVLDGGLEAWKAAGQPLSTEEPAPRTGRLTLTLHPELVVDADFVAGHLHQAGIAIIDARSRNFYDGAETRQGRNGHIPGAGSLFFGEVIGDSLRFKDVGTLKGLFAEAGVKPGDRVVAYCHIGQQASLIWLAARLAGFDAALYDGSFQDWARRSELPVTSGADR